MLQVRKLLLGILSVLVVGAGVLLAVRLGQPAPLPDSPEARLPALPAVVIASRVPPPPTPAPALPAVPVVTAPGGLLIKVYIVGAIAHPGVYTLAEGDRIEDLVRLAGGALGDADLDSLNLSARMHDEEQIRVPRRGETPVAPAAAPPPGAGGSAAAGTSPVANAPSGAKNPAPASVNINTADLAGLQTLPGIGPALAGRVIAYRQAHGPFARPEDITKVSGIGPAILAKIAPYIRTSP